MQKASTHVKKHKKKYAGGAGILTIAIVVTIVVVLAVGAAAYAYSKSNKAELEKQRIANAKAQSSVVNLGERSVISTQRGRRVTPNENPVKYSS